MIKKKKTKRKGLTQEDTLRTFITAQVQDVVGDLPSAEKVQLVETVAAMFGPSLVATVRAAMLALTVEPDDEDTEEEDEDEEYEDEEYEDEDEDEDEDEE